MRLTITTTRRPAGDLGDPPHKHPGKFQSFDLSFGHAHADSPKVGDDRCNACPLLDVDAVGLVRDGEPFLRAVFEPHGYQVDATRSPPTNTLPNGATARTSPSPSATLSRCPLD